jgi:hypothetical protein
MRFKVKSWGMTLLAIWLILMGLLPFLNISMAGLGTILNILAIVAGILILMNR